MGADYADASSFTDLFVTGNSYNRGRWSNPDYDAAVNAAASTHAGDPEARWQDLLEAEKSLWQNKVSFLFTKTWKPICGRQKSKESFLMVQVRNMITNGLLLKSE